MIAALVSRIADAKPSVIVIDKFFGQSTCPNDINRDLLAAMTEANSKVPIVVGRRMAEDTYLLPSLFGDVPDLRDAIVNTDQDTRKLPLKWPVFPSKSGMEHKTGFAWRETLSLRAAEIYEKGKLAERHPHVAKLLDPVRNPYISFLDLDQFNPFRFYAGYVLCGREVKAGEDATACQESPKGIEALSGKIVLIGEISRDVDMQTTVVGRIPGVFLQANFIEALLDDRYYEDFPVLNYIFAFLFLASIEAILVLFPDSWTKRAAAIAIVGLALLLLLYIVITDFHRYVNPVPLIALALLIRVLAANLPYFRERAKAR
jgi:CHASE2 domain-containing sensor protein